MISFALVLGFSFFGFSVGIPDCVDPCTDLWVARDCNKVDYCIKNVWTNLQPTGKTDDVCDICLRMVQEARNTLESKETEDLLKQVLEGSCRLLVLKPAVELCNNLVDNLIPQMVAVLASQMDPEAVCTVAKLCNNKVLRTLQKNSKNCTDCLKFMAASKETMKFVSEVEFKERLISLCRNAGSFSDACYGVSAKYSSFFYDHTKIALDGNPCEATLICPSNSMDEAAEDVKLCSSSLNTLKKRMCPMCVGVTSNIIKQFTKVKNAKDYHQNFVKICARFSFPEEFCLRSANNPVISKILKNKGGAFSRYLCSTSVCNKEKLEDVPVWPLVSMRNSDMLDEEAEDLIFRTLVGFIGEDDEVESEPEGSKEEKNSLKRTEDERPIIDCQSCKLAVTGVSEIVNNEKNEDTVKEAFNHFCNKLPKDSQEKCQYLIKTLNREDIAIVLRNLTSEEVCININFCPKHSPLKTISYGDHIDNPVFFSPVIVNPFYAADCKVCKKIAPIAAGDVKSNAGRIKSALEEVCLMSEDVEKCKHFLKKYSTVIVRVIAEYVSSGKACERIIPECEENGTNILYTENNSSVQLDKTVVESGLNASFVETEDSDCLACHKLTNSLSYLVNKRFVVKFLADSCLKMTDPEKCYDLLQRYSAPIIAVFQESTSSKVLCPKVISSCNSGGNEEYRFNKIPSVNKCQTCKMLMESIYNIFGNENNTIIKATFPSVCNKFPVDRQGECQQVITKDGNEILDSVVIHLPADEICLNLNYCLRKKNESEIMPNTSFESSGLEKVPCKFCLLLMKTLLDQLENNKTEASIEKALKNLCTYFPEEMKDTCQNIISQYLDTIVDMIIADFSPSEICVWLKVCKPVNKLLVANDASLQTFDINTNEVREAKEVEKIQTAILQVHSAVQECAMCEALVQVISSHKKMLVKDYDFSGNSSIICKIMPHYKRKQCKSMIVSYGPSIVNLIVNKNVKPNDVCLELTLCDSSMQARIDMPVSVLEPQRPLGSNDCTKGSNFWCMNEENARKCGALLHCREIVWKSKEPHK